MAGLTTPTIALCLVWSVCDGERADWPVRYRTLGCGLPDVYEATVMGFKAAALALTGLVLMTIGGMMFVQFLVDVCLSIVRLFS